jgi:hypothetical protein
MVKSTHFIEPVISTEQARIIHHCINIKKILLKTNAAVCFNKMCRFHHLRAKYTQIKVKGNNVKRTPTHVG